MKQIKIINAYKVIQKYEQKELPLDIAYAFFKLKKELADQWNFQIEREQAIYDKYSPKNEDGKLIFDSSESQRKFSEELGELLSMDVDWFEDKIKVDIGDRLMLSVADIEALDDFMTF